ncbi:bacterial Ig-like domain-containing protein [Lacticaseibacillus rhamnosus]|uniref:bacterial Ig-like domain-containing protein n=1 Tax=Lacticaseibacillus rhamnosus TaxID=47715 RepID=UPI0005E75656|nr:bacterial Ig-like domain-containing protein [Lacticaseibacillus rhamnosus]OFN05939.1 hypothetical protein HMPREF2621_12725 [Lactobacillus sp. HMSC072E07]MDK7183093.1 bacterial Ig-like domain-containing protein [Lacticaseibacillus rhamnosus]MDK7240979.1 bacterial Ig-like domain-containing protein [Lacticaseibacillus rhamnosus]MDT8865216.1 bacterial Ig-like domain-containing protein [Lacticaseibacillus rhamnosus]CDN23820.1 cell surface protein [Lacticaseibacillus rhamnosus]
MHAKIELKNLTLKKKESFQPEALLVEATDSSGHQVPLENFRMSGEVKPWIPGVYPIVISFTDPETNQQIENKALVTVIQ